MHDSGERKTGSTGAQTDPSHTNAAMELLSPYSLWQLSMWLGKGAEKYAPRNWEKGIPFSVCIGKLQRHLQQYLAGRTDEDHLVAVGFWWHAITHYESMIALGKLPASLNDLPQYERVQPFVIPDGWNIKCRNNDCGWFIECLNPLSYLWKDDTLHPITTGYAIFEKLFGREPRCGEAPGYWPTKEAAESALKQYLEKQK